MDIGNLRWSYWSIYFALWWNQKKIFIPYFDRPAPKKTLKIFLSYQIQIIFYRMLCNVLILCLPKYFKISTMTSSNIGKKMFIFCLLCNFIKLQGKITFQIYHWLLQSIIGPDWKTYLPHTTYYIYYVCSTCICTTSTRKKGNS